MGSLGRIADNVIHQGLLPVPAVSITDPGWLREQIEAAAVRYRCSRPTVLGVVWWYSASSAMLGPPVESLVAGGVAADPALANLTLYLHPNGLVLDARSDAVLGNDIPALGRRLERMLSTSIDAVADATGAHRRPLWAIATDSLANRVLWAGGPPAIASRIAAAIGDRLPVPRYIEVAGQQVVRRASCCLLYEAPGYEKCTSCPRQHPDDRHSRLMEALRR